MQGVNCLQDLKAKLTLAGFEINESRGWFITTDHGKWTIAHGVVYINSNPVKNIYDVPIKKKSVNKKSNGPFSKKIKSKKKS